MGRGSGCAESRAFSAVASRNGVQDERISLKAPTGRDTASEAQRMRLENEMNVYANAVLNRRVAVALTPPDGSPMSYTDMDGNITVFTGWPPELTPELRSKLGVGADESDEQVLSWLRELTSQGLLRHEWGHERYTDRDTFKAFTSDLQKMDPVVAQQLQGIWNSLEDGMLEERLRSEEPGAYEFISALNRIYPRVGQDYITEEAIDRPFDGDYAPTDANGKKLKVQDGVVHIPKGTTVSPWGKHPLSVRDQMRSAILAEAVPEFEAGELHPDVQSALDEIRSYIDAGVRGNTADCVANAHRIHKILQDRGLLPTQEEIDEQREQMRQMIQDAIDSGQIDPNQIPMGQPADGMGGISIPVTAPQMPKDGGKGQQSQQGAGGQAPQNPMPDVPGQQPMGDQMQEIMEAGQQSGEGQSGEGQDGGQPGSTQSGGGSQSGTDSSGDQDESGGPGSDAPWAKGSSAGAAGSGGDPQDAEQSGGQGGGGAAGKEKDDQADAQGGKDSDGKGAGQGAAGKEHDKQGGKGSGADADEAGDQNGDDGQGAGGAAGKDHAKQGDGDGKDGDQKGAGKDPAKQGDGDGKDGDQKGAGKGPGDAAGEEKGDADAQGDNKNGAKTGSGDAGQDSQSKSTKNGPGSGDGRREADVRDTEGWQEHEGGQGAGREYIPGSNPLPKGSREANDRDGRGRVDDQKLKKAVQDAKQRVNGDRARQRQNETRDQREGRISGGMMNLPSGHSMISQHETRQTRRAWGKQALAEEEGELSRAGLKLAAELQRMKVQARGPKRYKRTGKLDTKSGLSRAVAGSRYAMIEPGKKLNLDFELFVSIDRSGSIEASGQTADQYRMAKMFAVAGKETRMPTSIYGWDGGRGSTRHMEYKAAHSDDMTGLDAIFEDGGGGTPTAEGVELGRARLKMSKAAKRIMVVITDGAPNGDSMPNEEIQAAERAGITVIGLGFASGCSPDMMARCFGKNFAIINKFTDAPGIVADIVKRMATLS